MNITSVEIIPIKESNIKNYLAEVEVVIDYDFKIRDIKLMQGAKGPYLLFPVDKRNRGISYPVSDEVRLDILNKAVDIWESING